MKILVTGATGQLAQTIKSLLNRFSTSLFKGDFDDSAFIEAACSAVFTFVGREDFQITDKCAVDEYFAVHDVDAVINCAAFTAVDLAEDEPDLAFDVNVSAVKYLAEATEAKGAEFYHVSTDFVFDGEGHDLYKESDLTNPLSVYGATKLEGEHMALSLCSKSQVIRTSWLYSAFGNNFVKTIIRLASDRDKLTIIDDQVGTPTNAENLALAVLRMLFADKKHFNELYHYSDEGECSWCDFAREIVRLKEIDCVVLPIPSKDYPQKAHRPKFSVMDKSKIVTDYGLALVDWRVSLASLMSSFSN